MTSVMIRSYPWTLLFMHYIYCSCCLLIQRRPLGTALSSHEIPTASVNTGRLHSASISSPDASSVHQLPGYSSLGCSWCCINNLVKLLCSPFVMVCVKVVSICISKRLSPYGLYNVCRNGGSRACLPLSHESLGVLFLTYHLTSLHFDTFCSERQWLWCLHLGTSVIVLLWLHTCCCQNAVHTCHHPKLEPLQDSLKWHHLMFWRPSLPPILNKVPCTHVLNRWFTTVTTHSYLLMDFEYKIEQKCDL